MHSITGPLVHNHFIWSILPKGFKRDFQCTTFHHGILKILICGSSLPIYFFVLIFIYFQAYHFLSTSSLHSSLHVCNIHCPVTGIQGEMRHWDHTNSHNLPYTIFFKTTHTLARGHHDLHRLCDKRLHSHGPVTPIETYLLSFQPDKVLSLWARQEPHPQSTKQDDSIICLGCSKRNHTPARSDRRDKFTI